MAISDDAHAAVQLAVDALRRGQVVAYPTDTLYGLAVNPANGDAVSRLFALKGRPLDKAIPLIAADLDQVRDWTTMTPLAERLAASFWPGPLTLVVATRRVVDPRVLGDGGTVAIRVPDQGVARTLAAAAGCPITSTSANASGQPPTPNPDGVARTLPAVDVLVDDGVTTGGVASTIVDATGTQPILVRAGAIAWERVLESLGPASTPVVS